MSCDPLATIATIRAALEQMLRLFGHPMEDEYVDGGASYKLACETVANARTALALIDSMEPIGWRDIATAPRDGTAILLYGRHDKQPQSAQRGVQIGDHWWCIGIWDKWCSQREWVFAKDGEQTWSEPTHWQPLPPPPKETAP